jgi:hypothetical protein
VIALIVTASILSCIGALYLVARSGRWSPQRAIPPRHLPTELQCQELDRLAFQHRIRTRAVLDSALRDIKRATGEHRSGR